MGLTWIPEDEKMLQLEKEITHRDSALSREREINNSLQSHAVSQAAVTQAAQAIENKLGSIIHRMSVNDDRSAKQGDDLTYLNEK